MLHSFQALLQASVMERLTLLANHVISAETVARERLLPHAGKRFALQLLGWPSLLPPPPAMSFSVTPAGLLEWDGTEAAGVPDLALMLDTSHPVRRFGELLRGERPQLDIDGDSALATDLSWIIDNVRWDMTDDLAKLIGPGPAHELSRAMRAIAGGLRHGVETLRALAGKLAPHAPGRNYREPAAYKGDNEPQDR